jgi:hypothetical protein
MLLILDMTEEQYLQNRSAILSRLAEAAGVSVESIANVSVVSA